MGKINYTLLNASALNASRVNMAGEAGKPGGGGGGYWPEGTPDAIRRSAVLWYDIAKQGATNETMAANPVLKDLSGNGHDATCYNFGWAGMSGIGGYGFRNLESWTTNSNVRLNVIAPNKVTILGGVAASVYGIRAAFSSDTFIKIRVEGSSPENILNIYKLGDNDGVDLLQSITEDSIYTINVTYNNDSKYQQLLFAGDNITIEQLPQYPGALVSDGVDDYAYVDGLPLLTKERGFTVVAKRKWLEEMVGEEYTHSCGFATKSSTASVWNGAFIFEGVEGGGSSPFVRVFGKPRYGDFITSDISYMTSKSYKDKELTPGDKEDTDRLVLFNLQTVVNSNYVGKLALYSFILFDRDLTDEEIEWVRVNIMKAYTVAELCAMGYGVETSYGYNMKGDFAEAGVPVPSDLAARLAGEDGKLLKVTNLKADAAFWEARKV